MTAFSECIFCGNPFVPKRAGVSYPSLTEADAESGRRFGKVTPRWVTGASEGAPPYAAPPDRVDPRLPNEMAHDGTAESDVLGEDLSGKGGSPDVEVSKD
jgi:hypothetical protein